MADVFDALTSSRPYHSPVSYLEALNTIRELSGAHFDPAVVEIFESMKPGEWDKVRNRYLDRNDDRNGLHESCQPVDYPTSSA